MDAPKITSTGRRFVCLFDLPPMKGDRPGRRPRRRHFTLSAVNKVAAKAIAMQYMVSNGGRR